MTEERHAHMGLPDFHLQGPNHELNRQGVLRKVRLLTVVLLVLLALGLGKTLLTRTSHAEVLATRAVTNTKLHVLVTKPSTTLSNASARLALPGTLLGINEAQIYARVNGYVQKWFKDIGESVKKGDTLAILDIPEINKQVEEATANFQLAKTVYERWKRLRAEDAVSQQELDEKTGIFKQTEAILKRLRDQQSFGTIVAPFDGTITRRNVNLGDLVNSGNVGSPQAMFTIAHTDKLHVYVYVPQDRASLVRIGDEVDLYLANTPDKTVKGRIARTAGAIDTTTRTLQVDVEVPNPDRLLLPGSYVEVALKIAPSNNLIVPTNTLIFGSGGPYVARVVDNKIEKRKVVLGIDYGLQVEVKSGVAVDDILIINPLDSITNGQTVVIETPPATK
jgi:RND family efflux transporter MFP subunit